MARPTTSYNRMALALRKQILAGRLKAGFRLPSEHALCRQYGFSRITVRRALQILAEESLVIRHQGRGNFVAPRPRRKIPIVNVDFSRSVQRHAPELRRAVQAHRWETASRDWAATLGIPAGARILYARRADLLADRPICVDEVVIPARFASRLTSRDLRAMAFLEQWQTRERLALDYESQTIEALPATAPQTAWLHVKRGLPLLKETNLIYLRDGSIAALFISYYRYDYYQFNALSRVRERQGKIARAGIEQVVG